MIQYDKFRADIIKLNTPKKFRVSNSYGNKDAWRWIKKNKWLNIGTSVTLKDFGYVIKSINKYLVEQFYKGHDIVFPCRMGKLVLFKYFPKVRIKNNKLVTNKPIDWGSTIKLWYNDEEAYKSKILIRQDYKVMFRVLYSKKRANYVNKSFYHFSVTRAIKNELTRRALNNELDAFLIKK